MPGLTEARAGAEERLALARQATRSLEERLSSLSPASAEREASDTAQALRAADSRVHDLEKRLASQQGALEAADTAGLANRLDAARAQERRAREELDRLKRDAEAAKLLHDLLEERRNEARKRYLGPLVEETTRLPRLVFPEALPAFDDRFALLHLHRAAEERFEALSLGTREQVGLLVRPAMAGVLARGEPLPVVLDDPLVDTDEERFTRMIPALLDVARRVQFLVFTCHGARYTPLVDAEGRVIDLTAPRGR